MSDITLSAGVRSNLLSLQRTADMMSSTQNKLATGKAVNSALDNPNNFFTSQGLSNRANELSNLLDGIGNATKTLEAADNGIKAITKLVESAQSTVRQAQQANNKASGTSIQSSTGIDTTGASGSTAKERAQNQALSALGFSGSGSNINEDFTIESKSENGVVQTFDLQEHFTATSKALDDANGDGTTGDNYTVQNLVDDINASGIATASITDDGRLDLQASGNAELKLSFNEAIGANGDVTTSGNEVTTEAILKSDSNSILNKLGFGGAVDVNGDGGSVGGAGGTDVNFSTTDTSADAGSGTFISTQGVDTFTITNKATASDSADNSELVEQFNEILDQIDELATDSSYNGVNLVNGTGSDLTVSFNEKRDSGKSELTIKSADLTSNGLSLSNASSLTSDEANTKLDALSDALTNLRKQSSTFGSNLNTVKIRQEFTKDSINTLQTGADSLVLADTNEEGANMLALQTRQSLSTTALSLASQADQAVLRFLRA